MPLNLYKLHSDPKSLKGYSEMQKLMKNVYEYVYIIDDCDPESCKVVHGKEVPSEIVRTYDSSYLVTIKPYSRSIVNHFIYRMIESVKCFKESPKRSDQIIINNHKYLVEEFNEILRTFEPVSIILIDYYINISLCR